MSYQVPTLWSGPVVVIATGPSLTQEDVDYVRGKCPVIVVNDAHRLAPWANVLYASDPAWWNYYKGVPEFTGLKIIRDRHGGEACSRQWNLSCIKLNIDKKGWSHDPSVIHSGHNGGYQAGNLAVLFGGTKIIYLGLDMQGDNKEPPHFFGLHPKLIGRGHSYESWIRRFETIVQDGFEVVNCSRETALTCFRRSTIEAEL